MPDQRMLCRSNLCSRVCTSCDGPFHIGLPRAQPNFTDQHIFNFDLVLAFHENRRRHFACGLRGQLDLPSSTFARHSLFCEAFPRLTVTVSPTSAQPQMRIFCCCCRTICSLKIAGKRTSARTALESNESEIKANINTNRDIGRFRCVGEKCRGGKARPITDRGRRLAMLSVAAIEQNLNRPTARRAHTVAKRDRSHVQ